ncbi:hypothetical protein BD770DRAFT_220036 [Pilaira anomala]|nr:hypothetical protein BD770DRAFT_220036 [Pilaira anomala]
MTEQPRQKKTRRKLPRRNIIDAEFVSSPPTTSRLMDDFLLPSEHDQRILSDLWSNQDSTTTNNNTRPTSNLPNIIIGSTQKKKLIQPTSTHKTYSQRVQQNEKDTTDLSTQSIIPISLLNNMNTPLSKQVFSSSNQDSLNLTTSSQPSLDMSNHTSNDTQASIQQPSLKLITASSHLNITDKKESDQGSKDENKTERASASQIQEIEIVIERYISSSDDSDEEEEKEKVEEDVSAEVKKEVPAEVKKEVPAEVEEEVPAEVEEEVPAEVEEEVPAEVEEEVPAEVEKEVPAEVEEEVSAEVVEEVSAEVEEDKEEEEAMKKVKVEVEEEVVKEAVEDVMEDIVEDVVFKEIKEKVMGEVAEEVVEEVEEDKEEEDDDDEEFMDVEDTFHHDDLQACLFEADDVFVDAVDMTVDDYIMQDGNNRTETNAIDTKNDLMMEDESVTESLNELLTVAQDSHDVQSADNIQLIQEDHVEKNGTHQDPSIVETKDVTESENASEAEDIYEKEEGISDGSIHPEERKEESISDDSIHPEESISDDGIHPEESISDDGIHPEERQEEEEGASDDMIPPEESTNDGDLHVERQGPESTDVDDQAPAVSRINDYVSSFLRLRAVLDRQAGFVNSFFKREPTPSSNESETADLLVGTEPCSSQSSDVTLVGSIHEAVEAPPPDEDEGFIVVDPVEVTTDTAPSRRISHDEDKEIKAETMDEYLEGFFNTSQSMHDEPVIDEPMVDEPVIDEPMVDKPIIDEPMVDEPIIDQPMVDEPVIDEPFIDEPVIDEPVIDEPVIDEPMIDEPRIDDENGWICRDRVTPLVDSSHDSTKTQKKKRRIDWSEETELELSNKEMERMFKRRKIIRRRLEKARIVKKKFKTVWIMEDRR